MPRRGPRSQNTRPQAATVTEPSGGDDIDMESEVNMMEPQHTSLLSDSPAPDAGLASAMSHVSLHQPPPAIQITTNNTTIDALIQNATTDEAVDALIQHAINMSGMQEPTGAQLAAEGATASPQHAQVLISAAAAQANIQAGLATSASNQALEEIGNLDGYVESVRRTLVEPLNRRVQILEDGRDDCLRRIQALEHDRAVGRQQIGALQRAVEALMQKQGWITCDHIKIATTSQDVP